MEPLGKPPTQDARAACAAQESRTFSFTSGFFGGLGFKTRMAPFAGVSLVVTNPITIPYGSTPQGECLRRSDYFGHEDVL